MGARGLYFEVGVKVNSYVRSSETQHISRLAI